MIIAALMNVLIGLLDILLVFQIPSLPDGVMDYLGFAFESVITGLDILNNYIDIAYVFSLFSVIMVIETAYVTYKFIMWVVRKIPMLGLT